MAGEKARRSGDLWLWSQRWPWAVILAVVGFASLPLLTTTVGVCVDYVDRPGECRSYPLIAADESGPWVIAAGFLAAICIYQLIRISVRRQNKHGQHLP
jgi:hypothetical protein